MGALLGLSLEVSGQACLPQAHASSQFVVVLYFHPMGQQGWNKDGRDKGRSVVLTSLPNDAEEMIVLVRRSIVQLI